ncbi:MAG: RnfABCDGE type electron transport complex subunit B, partial [Pusillimonas sp.]|nr:RnfABCDGE type electron transport complex subunit B [Pusillimonas sp.]
MSLNALVEQVDEILPQTQCTQCGYNGCLPYAKAIVLENAPINRCPPGADAGIQALGRLLNRPETALDTSCGVPEPLQLAQINEVHCIGCTICIQACPTDAIVGASKLMHTVLADACTGCKLCVAPCPVD